MTEITPSPTPSVDLKKRNTLVTFMKTAAGLGVTTTRIAKGVEIAQKEIQNIKRRMVYSEWY